MFHLNRLIATTPQGTLFQLSFCLLLYNMIQVVRGYVAVGQQRAVETISTELLFIDVTKQLVALNELVEAERVVELLPGAASAAALRKKLGDCWERCGVSVGSKRSRRSASRRPRRRANATIPLSFASCRRTARTETANST